MNRELLDLVEQYKGSKKQSFIFKMKDLLVKDLSCRLPYNNTWLRIFDSVKQEWVDQKLDIDTYKKIRENNIGLAHVKVKLKPVEALTYSEVDEVFDAVLGSNEEADKHGDWIKFRSDGGIEFIFNRRSYKDVQKLYEWMYEHNVDLNNLAEYNLITEWPPLSKSK